MNTETPLCFRTGPGKTYSMPHAALISDDCAANLAFFLLENTGSIWGEWYGPMRAIDQRKLFGRFIGRGWVVINGIHETVVHNTSVCFGTMRENQTTFNWRNLNKAA